jgi:hypothetical protein
LGYVYAGIPWGWRYLTSIQPKMFLFLPIFGWILYLWVKLLLAGLVGIVEMPRGIIKAISTHKNEENIKNNLNN